MSATNSAIIKVVEALKLGDIEAVRQGLAQLRDTTTRHVEIARFLGISYMAIGEFAQARQYLEAAPESIGQLSALAGCCFRLKDYSASKAAAAKVLKLDPKNDVAKYCLELSLQAGFEHLEPSSNLKNERPSFRLLRTGDITNGMKLVCSEIYDPLDRYPGSPYMELFGRRIPRWDGSRVGHLMVVAGQGRGDAVQFVRWVQEASTRVDKLTLVTNPELVELFQRSGLNVVEMDAEAMVLATADAQTEIMLLPCAMELGYAPASGYLKAHGTLPASDKLRIGICWSASKDDRSAPLESLEPLRNLKGVEFYSLTYHVEAPDWMTPYKVHDFAQSADLMASMDLVISVDTVTAHLAGAIGRPVWIALQEPSEWRWQSGDSSPWYSTARLFRGDWAGIFTRMTEDISNGLL